MIILCIICAVIGWLIGIAVLLWIGVILLVCGLIALALGGYGHPVGPRRWYW